MSSRLRSAALGGAALYLVIAAGPALAADATEVADALVAAFAARDGANATYESASGSGGTITITGFVGTDKDGDTATMPTVVVTGAEMQAEGGFTADSMTFDNGKLVDQEATVSWQTGRLDDVVMPSAEEAKADQDRLPFEGVSMTGLNIEGDDLPAPITIASIDGTGTVDADGKPQDFDLKIAGFSIPAAVFAQEPEMKAVVDQLGYTNGFNGNLEVAGSYQKGGNLFTLETFKLDADEVGTLTIGGTFAGMVMESLGGRPDFSDGAIENLSIRFDNAGVVERVLDMQAQMMNMPREAFVAQTVGALPFMLNMLGNPPFQEKVATAAGTFLNDPKSITFSIAPAEPVKIDDIAGAAMVDPGTLPDILSADITANN